MVSDTLNSPQGDGNKPEKGYKGCGTKLSDTLNSPQGDGNSDPKGERRLKALGQTPSIPRKGTETLKIILERLHLLDGQTPSIPRKGTETTALRWERMFLADKVRHPQFPARGRKPLSVKLIQ